MKVMVSAAPPPPLSATADTMDDMLARVERMTVVLIAPHVVVSSAVG